MIESNIIKRFIVKTFMQNSECGVQKIAEMVMNILSSRFMLNENVIVPSRELYGKIVKCTKNIYTIHLEDNTTVEVPSQEIKRRYVFDYNDVCYFLECITSSTPLGRIVIENVFEKISQPGFGVRMPVAQGFGKYAPGPGAGMSDSEKHSNIFQDVELKQPPMGYGRRDGHVLPFEHPRDSAPRLSLKSLRRVEVDGFHGPNLRKLITIYSYFKKLQIFNNISLDSLQSFAKEILDQEYGSQTVMSIHKFLVECIEKDVGNYGMRFINELSHLVKRFPAYKPEAAVNQEKRRSGIEMDNWKSQLKAFLHNLSIDCNSERILRFLDFANTLELRLNLLLFLINVSYFTDTLKSVVHDSQNFSKNQKLNPELVLYNKKNKNLESDDTDDNNVQRPTVLDNPLSTHIGRYRDYLLILVDRDIVLKDKDDFYILEQKDVKAVLDDTNPFDKVEKVTCANLKTILHELKETARV